MNLFCRRKLKKFLNPIEYYSGEISNFSIQNSKVSADVVKKCLKPYLEKILLYYDMSFQSDFAQIPGIITQLMETADCKSEKTIAIPSNIEVKKIMMYYSGTITQSREKSDRIYKSCKFRKSEAYAFLVNCLVRLYGELIYPDKDTPFEDFPEHIVATYNILCYYYYSGNSQNVAEICRALYSLSDYYIANEEILCNSSRITKPITNNG